MIIALLDAIITFGIKQKSIPMGLIISILNLIKLREIIRKTLVDRINYWLNTIKGARKSCFSYCSCVVIILFSTGLYKSSLSTYFLENFLFVLLCFMCFLPFFCFEFYNICIAYQVLYDFVLIL